MSEKEEHVPHPHDADYGQRMREKYDDARDALAEKLLVSVLSVPMSAEILRMISKQDIVNSCFTYADAFLAERDKRRLAAKTKTLDAVREEQGLPPLPRGGS